MKTRGKEKHTTWKKNQISKHKGKEKKDDKRETKPNVDETKTYVKKNRHNTRTKKTETNMEKRNGHRWCCLGGPDGGKLDAKNKKDIRTGVGTRVKYN